MKKNILFLVFTNLLFLSECLGQMIFGETFQLLNITPSSLIRGHNAFWAAESQSYVNGVGVTFNYPVGLFATPPEITVQIENSGLPYATTLIASAFVTANTATSTTVRVNLFTVVGGVVEAATGDVIVHLHALGSSPV